MAATLHLGPPAPVSTAQASLWKSVEDLSRDPGLGVRLIQEAEPAVYPPASLTAFHARGHRDGLARTARLKQLCAPEKLHVVEAKGECTITSEWRTLQRRITDESSFDSRILMHET